MRRALVPWAVAMLLGCGDEGSSGQSSYLFCPVLVPAEGLRCKTQGLLCFYSGRKLVDECEACTQRPCAELAFECNVEGTFAPIEAMACDGGLGHDDAGAN